MLYCFCIVVRQTTNRQDEQDEPMAQTRFSAWLDRVRKRRDLNYTGLAALAGVGPNTARAWCLGLSEPTPDNVKTLAAVFSVSVRHLYELLDWLPSEEEAPDYGRASEVKHRIVEQILQAHDDDLDTIEQVVDALLERAQREARGHTEEEGLAP